MSQALGESRASKRSRISESCKLCRSKKTRCDGQRPTCSPCLSKNAACEYNERHVPISSDVLAKIAQLEARVRKLEGQSIAAGQPQASSSPASVLPEPQHERLLTYADNPTTQFISSVTHILHPQDSHPQTQLHNIDTDTNRTQIQFSLPSREVADDFIGCYERLVYPMFPVLHMPSFRKRYLQLWDLPPRPQPVDATFGATINIVFALGCVNSSKVEPRLALQTARSFYEQARGIMPLDSLDSPSLEVVQCLLLTGNYLSFTKYSHRYCNTLAVAIQIAQTVGLHQVDIHSSSNQLQREMSRRVWHLCLTIQRLMSSLFGWKSMVIHDHTCPLPQNIDDAYLMEEGEGIQPLGKPSLLDALAASINIFNIVAEAREVNMTCFTGELQISELTKTLQLNEKLNKIEADLPDHLKYIPDSGGNMARDQILRFQAEVVNIRILYLRLLILRKNLLATARQLLGGQEPTILPSYIETTLRDEIFRICVQSALSALDILHANLQSPSKIISANALFVTLSAATVLIASSVIPGIGGNLEDPSSAHALGIAQGFEILDSHESRVEGASETKTKLKEFLQTVKNATRYQQQAQDNNQPSDTQDYVQSLDPGEQSFFGDIDLSSDLWAPNSDWMLYL